MIPTWWIVTNAIDTLMRKRSKESFVRASLDANESKCSRLWELSLI